MRGGSSPGEPAALNARRHGRPCGRGGGCRARREAAVVALRVESSEAPAPLFDGDRRRPAPRRRRQRRQRRPPLLGLAGCDPRRDRHQRARRCPARRGISWRGNWNPSFRDFFIDRIGPYASRAPDRYWSLTVNGRFSAGGCLTQVAAGDSIRFFYGPLFGAPPRRPRRRRAARRAAPPAAAGSGKGAKSPSRKALRRIVGRRRRFLRGHRGIGVGWAKLALALRGDGSPAPAAAELIGEKLESQLPDGSLDHDVNATALAVLALVEDRPRAARRAVTGSPRFSCPAAASATGRALPPMSIRPASRAGPSPSRRDEDRS